jgi:hypothetical protein
MVTRKYTVRSHDPVAAAGPFAGSEIQMDIYTEKDRIHVRMTRQHAEALRSALDAALRRLDQVAVPGVVEAHCTLCGETQDERHALKNGQPTQTGCHSYPTNASIPTKKGSAT